MNFKKLLYHVIKLHVHDEILYNIIEVFSDGRSGPKLNEAILSIVADLSLYENRKGHPIGCNLHFSSLSLNRTLRYICHCL